MIVLGDVSTICTIKAPTAVTVTANGVIFVTSYAQNVVYKVTKQGRSYFLLLVFSHCTFPFLLFLETGNYEAVIFLGSVEAELNDGAIGISRPYGIVIDEASHSCFLVESSSHKIKRISFL